MKKTELIRFLQDMIQKIRWYFVCCRRIQNDNYKLALYCILQKIQSIIRWLSNENMYPNTDEYNKMKVHYEMFLLQFEKEKLAKIEKAERLKSRDMQNITYLEINKLLIDLNIIKNELFNKDREFIFNGFSDNSIIAMNLENYSYLLETSCNIMPDIVSNILKTICNQFISMKKYIQNTEELDVANSEEIDKRLQEIFEQFDMLECYKDDIRIIEPVPAIIVELAYNVYSQVYIILKEFKDNKKTNLTVYNCEII